MNENSAYAMVHPVPYYENISVGVNVENKDNAKHADYENVQM